MVRVIIIFFFMLLVGISLTEAADTNPHDHRGQSTVKNCVPDFNQVTVFQYRNYKGYCSVLDAGEYLTSKDMRMKNDTVSSIMIGRNMQIEACVDANVAKIRRRAKKNGRSLSPNFGNCETIRQSRPKLVGLRGGTVINDNVISSVTIQQRAWDKPRKKGACNPEAKTDAVAIYKDPDLKGECRILGVGSYANSKEMNFKNDSVSSIEFSYKSSVYIEVCRGSNFRFCETIRVTELNLGNNFIRDNSLTSMKVIRYPTKLQGKVSVKRR